MNKKIIAIFLFVLCIFTFNYINLTTVHAETSEVVATIGSDEYTSLSEAVTNAVSGDTIFISGDRITLSSSITVKDKAITIDFKGATLDRVMTYTKNMFTVAKNSKLTIKNVVVDGGAVWELDEGKWQDAFDCYVVSGEAFNPKQKKSPAVLKEGINTTASLFNTNGELIIENASISNYYTSGSYMINVNANSRAEIINISVTNCATLSSGLVVSVSGNSPYAVVKNSVIENNYVQGNGGIFRIYGTTPDKMGIVELYYTSVSHNRGINANGVVAMMYDGVLIFNSGKMNNNIGIPGTSNGRNAPVYIHGHTSKFIMNGGEIKHNTAGGYGAVDTGGRDKAVIELNAGDIYDNVTLNKQTDWDIYSASPVTLGKDIVIDGDMSVSNTLVNNGIVSGDIVINVSTSAKPDDILFINSGDVIGKVTLKVPDSLLTDDVFGKFVSGNSEILKNIVYMQTVTVPQNVYKITFEYNGGKDFEGWGAKEIACSGDWKEHLLVKETQNYVSREEYRYLGVYTNSECTEIWNLNNEIDSNITLYIGWEEIPERKGNKANPYYYLNFETNGGTKIESIRAKSGTMFYFDEYETTREGYSLEGWYIDKTLTMKRKALNLRKPTTIYAKWIKNEALSYEDINKSDWFYKEVLWMNEKEFMLGINEDSFAPNEMTTRAMIVEVLWNIEGKPKGYDVAFDDVKSSSKYYDAIAWAKANNIVLGFEDDTFKLEQKITREQLAAILYRYSEYKGYNTTLNENEKIEQFDDFTNIQEWALIPLKWCVENELILGFDDNYLRPKDSATRAQTASIFYRFLNK
ncbi:MAG: S-layer homology domain-containing protein [Clostridia bacterium]|nr:S-layer homology domain-containing protein [Clostridia bacterium]